MGERQLNWFGEDRSRENQTLMDFTAKHGLASKWAFKDGWTLWGGYLREIVGRIHGSGDVHPGMIDDLKQRYETQIEYYQ